MRSLYPQEDGIGSAQACQENYQSLYKPVKDILPFLESRQLSLFKNKIKVYQVFLSTGLDSLRIQPAVCVFHTVANSSLVRADFLKPSWLDSIHLPDSPNICSACRSSSEVSGTVPLQIRMSVSRFSVNSVIICELVLRLIFKTRYSHKFINFIHPTKRQVVHYNSTPLLILMGNNDESEARIEKLYFSQKATELSGTVSEAG